VEVLDGQQEDAPLLLGEDNASNGLERLGLDRVGGPAAQLTTLAR
jgi:hypothetical protein